MKNIGGLIMLKRKEHKVLFNSSLAALGYIRPQINNVMEREIGVIFNYNKVKLQIVESNGYCNNCYFNDSCITCTKPNTLDKCQANNRKDNKNIHFKEIKE